VDNKRSLTDTEDNNEDDYFREDAIICYDDYHMGGSDTSRSSREGKIQKVPQKKKPLKSQTKQKTQPVDSSIRERKVIQKQFYQTQAALLKTQHKYEKMKVERAALIKELKSTRKFNQTTSSIEEPLENLARIVH